MKLWQYHSKITQNEIPKFSILVQVGSISLFGPNILCVIIGFIEKLIQKLMEIVVVTFVVSNGLFDNYNVLNIRYLTFH